MTFTSRRLLFGIWIIISGLCLTTEAQYGTDLPNFLTEPSNVTVEDGKTARLECSADFLFENQVVAWMKESTFETSGQEILVDSKASRYYIKKNVVTDRVEYHLDILNVTFSDAGSYSCYIVEFGEHNSRRWRGSQSATLTVVPRWVRPKLRCYEPPAGSDSDGVVITNTSVAVGCSVRYAQWSRSLELQKDGISLITDDGPSGSNTTFRRLRYRIKPGNREEYVGTFTCAVYYTLVNGSTETKTCTIGTLRVRKPIIPTTPTKQLPLASSPQPPPAIFEHYDADHILWVKEGEDARFDCPPLGSVVSKRLAWTIYPPLSPNRYTFQNDGNELSITNVTEKDTGILVACVTFSEETGRQDVETLLRVGDESVQYAEQVGDTGSRPRPPSSISGANSRPGYNGGRRVVIPDMENIDWQLLASKWNGIRDGIEADFPEEYIKGGILDLDIKLPPKRMDFVNPLAPVTSTVTPSGASATTRITSPPTATPYDLLHAEIEHEFNESMVIGPPINIRDLLPKDILKSEVGKPGKQHSLFTGLILVCGTAMICILLLVLTLGLRCHTNEPDDEKKKHRPVISEPIPLSLPEICNMTDSTYEEMHANVNAFPAHATVAGPTVTILGPRDPTPPTGCGASSCNSELVFGSHHVDYSVDPSYPSDHIYGGSLTPSDHIYGGSLSPSINPALRLNVDHLPPPDVCYHPDPIYTHRRAESDPHDRFYGAANNPVYSADLVYGTDTVYGPDAVYNPDTTYGTPYHQDLDTEYLPQRLPHDFTYNNQHHNDQTQGHRSSTGSDPYGFEPLEPVSGSRASQSQQRPIHIKNPAFRGRLQNPSTGKEDLDPDYLQAPVRVSTYYKGPPPDCCPEQQPPYGLYEVL